MTEPNPKCSHGRRCFDEVGGGVSRSDELR